jgi:glycosyltransferase involved in cell wall biosynthesis
MEQVVLDLSRYFVAAGHDVSVLIPQLATLEGMAAEARALGANVEPVGPLHSEGHDVVRNGAQLVDVLRRLRPDVVHFHVPAEPVCFESVGASIARVPIRIRTEHNPVLQASGKRQRLKMRVMDLTFHRIVYLSQGNRRAHLVRLGRRWAGSTIIGNGVDPLQVNADRSIAHRRQVRLSLNLPLEPEIAVMVGTLEQRKGPLDFVRAARVAASIHPRMHFAIIGDGDLRVSTEELASELGVVDRVHFLGRRQDVRELLSTFDLYVQASHYEGMSVAMLEALAAGLPMVTTRVDGVEDVLPGGSGALLVNIADWHSLGVEIARLAHDSLLRQQLATISQQRVLADFTVDAVCARYRLLYRALGAIV